MYTLFGSEIHTLAPTATNLGRLIGLWLAYRVLLILYNVSPLHPLYRFPGPRLAAASFVYEFWFDAVKFGRYGHEIKRLHEIYGPVIRINPEELHCNDPDFIDEIYAGSSRKRNKQQHYLNVSSGSLIVSAFASIDHDLHRVRRGALNRYFSRGQMIRLEPEVRALSNTLCDKMLRSTGTWNVADAFSCLSSDIIAKYAFGEAPGFVAQAGWYPNYREPLRAFTDTVYIWKFCPWLSKLMVMAPYFAKYAPGDVGLLMRDMFEVIPGRIDKAIKSKEAGEVQTNVWVDILESNMPPEEKTPYRMSGEGFSLMSAGTETTSTTLTLITYYLLAQPDTLACLTNELRDLDANNLSWVELENRPFLSGVIQEGLRLSMGISTRNPRVPRDESLVYRKGKYEYFIPKGTPIGMSSAHIHLNEDIFPNAERFMPERWLDEKGRRSHDLDKYILSFSRGSRQCLGINLAYCELFLVTAAMTLRALPHMALHETGEEAVKYDHDLLIAQPKRGTTGVWVKTVT